MSLNDKWKSMKKSKRREARTAEKTERRNSIKKLIDGGFVEGLSKPVAVEKIARKVLVTSNCVRNDLKALGNPI